MSQTAIPPIIEQPRPPSADLPAWNDPLVDRLGYVLAQAAEEFGAPKEVYSIRDPSDPALDSVVFYYEDYSYLFWWRNRLWQLRFDKRYQSDFMGLRMGQPRSEVEKTLGKPLSSGTAELIYQLPDRGFPVRVRLLFEQGKLSDFYLYRSDF